MPALDMMDRIRIPSVYIATEIYLHERSYFVVLAGQRHLRPIGAA